jgi:hypothetical protein
MTAKMPSRNSRERLASDEQKLTTFLANNPYSRIDTVESKTEGEIPIVSKPWNDESLVLLLLPQSKRKVIDALNNLILPPRFTAIYHTDINTMEYIYTRLKQDAPIASRRFTFDLDSKHYSCKFDKASERLMLLVSCFARAQETRTDFRNLIYLEEESPPGGMEPVSFYVSGFHKYDENEILEISRYLNFFMQYYDRE